MKYILNTVLLLASTYCLAQNKDTTYFVSGQSNLLSISTLLLPKTIYDTTKVRMLYDTLMPVLGIEGKVVCGLLINGYAIRQTGGLVISFERCYLDENKRILNNDKVWLSKSFNW